MSVGSWAGLGGGRSAYCLGCNLYRFPPFENHEGWGSLFIVLRGVCQVFVFFAAFVGQ